MTRQSKPRYVKGRTIFITTLLVIGLTIITVFLTGINFHRSLSDNFYISLSIIATALFIFLLYGLYTGLRLLDDPPKFGKYQPGSILAHSSYTPNFGAVDVGEGLAGILLSILLWIAMAISFVVFLLVLEALVWISIVIIMAMLYWLFMRAFKLVLHKSSKTKGDLAKSVLYSFGYTLLYCGWLFGIVLVSQLFK